MAIGLRHGLSLLACTQLFNYWVSNFKAEQRLWWLQVHVIVDSGWGVSYSLCVAVCARSVPLRHFRLSQLCTNSPPGSSGLSHLLSACWASSNLAASDGATGALGVSSPQDCQKSSVKSPYRLALQAPRKLTRRRDGGEGPTLAATSIFLFMLQQYYTFIKRLPLRSQPVVISFVRATAEAAQKNEMDFAARLPGSWPAGLFTS